MVVNHILFLFSICTLFCSSIGQLSDNKDELLSWCLKSESHKHQPGKEDSLHQQCSPWKNYACCTEEVTRDIHGEGIYNFTFDHCYSVTKRNMSARCRRHFNQDNCFYECEPHIGLWVAQTNRKIASQRFFEVPLCASDCDEWFEDCKDDFTCARNWPQDFKFKNGKNTCREESKCVTFKQTYSTAKEFCENVWDHSWKYTPDDQPCVKIWFDSEINPNKKVAEYYIDEYLKNYPGEASSFSVSHSLVLSLSILLYISFHTM